MEDLKERGQPDRIKINIHAAHEVQYWTKHLNISRDELQKVGWTRCIWQF